jgi:hypothetical protein
MHCPVQGRRERARTLVKKFFSPPPPPSKGKNKETKQRASYGRWPLAASAVNMTNHYIITSGTTEKDKNVCNIIGPTSGPPAPCNFYRLPLPLFRRHWSSQVTSSLENFTSKLCLFIVHCSYSCYMPSHPVRRVRFEVLATVYVDELL